MTRVKATICWPNGKVYFFDAGGTTYTRADFVSGQRDQGAQDTAQNWRGLPSGPPDAALWWGFGKAYFFYGGSYLRYDVAADAVDADYLPPNAPMTIAGNWPLPWTDRLDAAVNWGNGKVYFFRDGEYVRYDLTLDQVDDGYPKPIADNWHGLWPEGIDAALYQGGRKAYFFRGDEYRRYDLDSDAVDQSGLTDSLILDPVPAGLCTAARDLTPEAASRVMGYLIQWGKLSLSATRTPYAGDWLTGITSPAPSTHVVIAPAQVGGVDFVNEVGAAPLIDNVDQRMVVALYRLTRWLNASEPDVTTIRHLGIGHGSGPPNDCHNQGRALDFSGLEGSSGGADFSRSVLRDWGNVPVSPGVALRLDQTRDPLAYLLFQVAFRFGTFECECNGIGAANHWPPKDIGDVGGFVIHPDYVDVPPPGQQLRPQHQNHIHMQVGVTR